MTHTNTTQSPPRHLLRHEYLHAYQVAVEVAQGIRKAPWPRGTCHLKDQSIRASESMVLNLAEGCYRENKARANQFRICMGSAAEVCAALDLVELPGSAALQAKLRRVVAMVLGLR